MATLAQLQDEPWWGAEVETPAMRQLAAALCTHFRVSRTAAGIKGDERHLRGAHRSRSWILRSAYCTNRAYTVTRLDDLAGDENWCAGLDFNPGRTETLVAICRRLDAATRAGRIEEVSEWYGNVDGDAVVDGWNNVLDRAATSDSSHLWHLHITVKRRYANDLTVMRRLYEILTGDDMAWTDRDISHLIWRVKAIIHDEPAVSGGLGVGEVNNLHTVLAGLRARLVELEGRPPVQSAPVDPATLKAVLLDPDVLAAIAEATADEQKRRLEA